MARFRKRPPEIEAIQWTGENKEEIIDFAKKINSGDRLHITYPLNELIVLLHAKAIVLPIGGYVFKDSRYGFYALNKESFEKQYEPIVENQGMLTDVVCRGCLGTGVIDRGNGDGSTCYYCFGTGISII